MSKAQNIINRLTPPQKDPEIVELTEGMRRFLDILVQRMLEKDIKQYYSSRHSWNPSCPQNNPQTVS